MRRNFTYYSWLLCIATAIFMNFAFAYGQSFSKDTTFYHKKTRKTSYLKNGLPFSLPPLKPGETSYVKVNIPKADDKLLNDVEVFPNPATDQLNFKYTLSRNSSVSIKIMDVLGNEVLTVFQERVDLGEQKLNYPLNNKLTRGFYFVRIVAGTESVIKRISIL
jgi:hypothetical protein